VSIQPPSDILLDVAQAADPMKSLEATQRLMRLGTTDKTGIAFSGVMKTTSPEASILSSAGSRIGGGAGSLAHGTMPVSDDPQAKAFKGLQALIFQNLFEVALPHDTSMGNGMAGDAWRSMMAEHLAKQMSEVVDLGIMPKTGSLHDALELNKHTHHSAASSDAPFNQRKSFGRTS